MGVWDCFGFLATNEESNKVENTPTHALLDNEKSKLETSNSPANVSSAEKPRPQIFAIMRNGHEVLRGSVHDASDALKADNLDAFSTEYSNLLKWQEVHALMEDGDNTRLGVFGVLNKEFEGVAKQNGLNDIHDQVHAAEKAVHDALASGDLEATRSAWESFVEVNENHYVEEEKVMMPKVGEMAKAGKNMKQVMKDEILPLAIEHQDFDFFVTFAMSKLEVHHHGKPRARIWAHALLACANNEQYSKWLALIESSLKSKDLFEEIRGISSRD